VVPDIVSIFEVYFITKNGRSKTHKLFYAIKITQCASPYYPSIDMNISHLLLELHANIKTCAYINNLYYFMLKNQ
jgi:hypothetical protein